tara:strand:- start:303 stop:602 length:300 start_codon:yes stop_codon:yes gene_type:complete
MLNTIQLKECLQYGFDLYSSQYAISLKEAIIDACQWLEDHIEDADSHLIFLCDERGTLSIQSCHIDDEDAFMDETKYRYSSIKLVGGYNLGGDMETTLF